MHSFLMNCVIYIYIYIYIFCNHFSFLMKCVFFFFFFQSFLINCVIFGCLAILVFQLPSYNFYIIFNVYYINLLCLIKLDNLNTNDAYYFTLIMNHYDEISNYIQSWNIKRFDYSCVFAAVNLYCLILGICYERFGYVFHA